MKQTFKEFNESMSLKELDRKINIHKGNVKYADGVLSRNYVKRFVDWKKEQEEKLQKYIDLKNQYLQEN
jgi:hypothetical protein